MLVPDGDELTHYLSDQYLKTPRSGWEDLARLVERELRS